ncbi:MAG: twin-arginine translocation signal domain-containing protein, partial [Planctomyces sp.]
MSLKHAGGHRSGQASKGARMAGNLQTDSWDEMSPDERIAAMTRRSLLARSAVGPGAAALFSMLSGNGFEKRVLAAGDFGDAG